MFPGCPEHCSADRTFTKYSRNFAYRLDYAGELCLILLSLIDATVSVANIIFKINLLGLISVNKFLVFRKNYNSYNSLNRSDKSYLNKRNLFCLRVHSLILEIFLVQKMCLWSNNPTLIIPR